MEDYKMKIVHLCLASFYIDNYSYQENMLPKHHVLQGHDVTVIASLVSFNKQGKSCLLENESVYQSENNFKVIRVDYKKPIYRLNRFFRIYNKTYKIIREESPDIIFIHGLQFWDISRIIDYKKKNPKVRIIIDNHADSINSAKNWLSKNILHKIIWRYFAKAIEPYTETFYGVLPNRCEFLHRMYGIKKSKIKLLVMGVDDSNVNFNNREIIKKSIREKHDISDQDFVIISGGKIDKLKNIHLLLKAINEINNKNIKLLYFGTIVPEMLDTINAQSNNESIKYLGWLSGNDINNYILASDLAIYPGTHSVLWEQSVGLGIPCIFKYWEGITHIDVNGNCRFLYKDNVAEIKDEILRIINNKEIFNRMKSISESKGKNIFTYSTIAKKAISI